MEFPEFYNIQFDRLKLGKHEFNFNPDEAFFNCFEKSTVKEGDISVLLVFFKQSNTFFNLDFYIKGITKQICDRCLSDFELSIDEKYNLIIKFKSEDAESDVKNKPIDDDIIFLTPETKEINVAQYIYEFINLSIPMKKACEEPNENCDTEILKKLNQINKSKGKIDPRWEALKKLTDNKN